MPVRNGIKFLPKVSQQLDANSQFLDEIVLINDGSIDGTEVFLRGWHERNSKLTVINLDGCGIVKALNVGIAHSSSKWIARFDVDDFYSADRIEKQLAAISTETVAVFSDYRFISQNGISLGLVPSGVFPTSTFVSLFSGNRTAHSSAMLNREALLDVGGYQENDHYIEDLSLWLRLSSVGSIHTIPETLVGYRLNAGSITSDNRQSMLSAKKSLLNEFDFYGNISSDFLSKVEQDFFNYSLTSKTFERQLLLTKDLMFLDSLYGIKTAQNLANRFVEILLRSPSCYSPAIRLFAEQKIRKMYRRKIFSN